MKYRVKKKCGNCKHISGFPYIHCRLGCELEYESKESNTIVIKPKNPIECRNKRNPQFKNIDFRALESAERKFLNIPMKNKRKRIFCKEFIYISQ